MSTKGKPSENPSSQRLSRRLKKLEPEIVLSRSLSLKKNSKTRNSQEIKEINSESTLLNDLPSSQDSLEAILTPSMNFAEEKLVSIEKEEPSVENHVTSSLEIAISPANDCTTEKTITDNNFISSDVVPAELSSSQDRKRKQSKLNLVKCPFLDICPQMVPNFKEENSVESRRIINGHVCAHLNDVNLRDRIIGKQAS
jgi:hypothetical protein